MLSPVLTMNWVVVRRPALLFGYNGSVRSSMSYLTTYYDHFFPFTLYITIFDCKQGKCPEKLFR